MFTKKMSVKMKHLLHLSMKNQDCEHENKIKMEGKEKLFKQRSAEFLEGVISPDVSIQSYSIFINSVERVKVKGYECKQHCFTVYRTARNELMMKLSSQQDASICNVASSLEGSQQNQAQY